MYPAMMLEIAVDEPSDNTTPRNSEMPLKAADPDPGMYGYATTSPRTMMANRTIL